MNAQNKGVKNSKGYSGYSENELLYLIGIGNDLAYAEIVNRYKNVVATVVKSMLGNSHEAEDVGHEVFIRFYKSLKTFRGESSLKTYLTKIAVNLSINEIKRRKRRLFIPFFSHETDKTIDFSGENPNHTDTTDLVRTALECLSVDFRSIVVLRMIQGYTIKETAQILGIKEGTVLSRLSRAQEKLKDLLKNHI